ncbi:MAG: prolipoprotein diacylglyceryl transferase family protein [Bacteroidota bacterium]
MYPSLYHFLLETFGIEITLLKVINTFGLFVAFAFVGASICQSKELMRKFEEGKLLATEKNVLRGKGLNVLNLVINLIIGFLIGFKLIYLLFNQEEATIDPPAFFLSSTGSVWGGILVSLLFGYSQYRDYIKEKKKYPEEKNVLTKILPQHLSGNITLVAAIFGIAGAKLFHLLENPKELQDFFSDFSAQNFLSGLTIYGGLIVGGIAVLIYMYRNKIHPLHGADANAPGLFLAYGIGRLGCHFSGDGDWGIANSNPKPFSWLPDWLWSYPYPNNVLSWSRYSEKGGYTGKALTEDMGYYIHEGYGTYLDPGVYPTPVYEALFSIAVFFLLWKFRKKFIIPGTLLCVYLMINGFERFWIEKIRVNEDLSWWSNVTQAELISVSLFLLGLIGFIYLKKRNKTDLTLQ